MNKLNKSTEMFIIFKGNSISGIYKMYMFKRIFCLQKKVGQKNVIIHNV